MVPKFRAWDERVGLTEVVSIDFFRKKIKINHWEYGDSNFFPLDEVVLMQSTGLKDKNGVDIFEGDVGWDAHFEEYGEVVFENGSFRYEFGNISEDLFEVTDDIEIVGNIYENPELLEQADES